MNACEMSMLSSTSPKSYKFSPSVALRVLPASASMAPE